MPYKDPAKQKAAQAAHFQANKARYADNHKAARERRRAKIRAAKAKPCADCGVEYPYYVMQFDHVGDDKVASISRMLLTASWAAIEEEIAKCDVVCANCHAVRTWKRVGEAQSV